MEAEIDADEDDRVSKDHGPPCTPADECSDVDGAVAFLPTGKQRRINKDGRGNDLLPEQRAKG